MTWANARCPDEETLLRFPHGVGEDVHRHVAMCADCRDVLRCARSAPPSANSVDPAMLSFRAIEERRVLKAGDRVGRYTVRGIAGVGSMGIVYDAWDDELSRRIALKFLRPDLAAGRDGEALCERLKREARALAKLRDPHVVTLHDVGAHAGQTYLAMEFVEGPKLPAWIRQFRPPREEILLMFQKLGRGLLAAHEAGLVHRDFKPDNILVSPRRGAIITDFGLADDLHAARGRTLAAGTPLYMAPEVSLGERASPRSDQFSFCATLYEALTGQHPFRDGRDVSRLGKLSPPLIRGLSLDPDRRFESMAALLHALAKVAAVPKRPLLGPSLIAWVALCFSGNEGWHDRSAEREGRHDGSAEREGRHDGSAERVAKTLLLGASFVEQATFHETLSRPAPPDVPNIDGPSVAAQVPVRTPLSTRKAERSPPPATRGVEPLLDRYD